MTDNDNKPYLNDDLHFLVSCCKTDPSEDDIKYIHTYLSQITDDHGSRSYDDIIHLTYQHGIVPLVYKTLKKLSLETSYKYNKILSTCKQAYLNIAQRNMLMSAELIRIMKLLEDNSIEALAFKGPVLSQIAYGDITLRKYVDLDILVKKQDIFKAGKILESNSYMASGSIEFLDDPVWVANAKDMTFINEKKSVAVEMHWKLFQDRYAKRDHMIDFWLNPNNVKISNKIIKTLETNILLVYLCIHGSMHVWERIEWIADIDRLIKAMEIDWDKTLIFAEEFQAKTMFILGLSVVHDLFGTKLPQTIMKLIQQKKIIKLKDFTLESLQIHDKGYGSLPGLLHRAKFHANMQDTYANKFKYWQHTIFHKHHKTMLHKNQTENNSTFISFSRPIELIQKYLIPWIKH